jgi:hypothetical protein
MHWHLQVPSQRRIHATTRLGIMPRHCSANSRGAAIPATVRCCAAWSATTLWHCATHSRMAGAPHPWGRTTEPSKGRRTTTPRPCRYNAMMSGRRDRSPPSPSALCDYPRRPRCHPGHCIAIPDTVEATVPPYGLASTAPSSPHTGGCRTRDRNTATLEAAPGRAQDAPWRPAGGKIRQDGRLLCDAVHHASTRRWNSAARL